MCRRGKGAKTAGYETNVKAVQKWQLAHDKDLMLLRGVASLEAM